MDLQFETTRLLLRFFELSDAKMVRQLAGNEEVARTALAIGCLIGNRIFAAAMTKNPGSYKVMRKIGMKEEGTFPQLCIEVGNLRRFSLLRNGQIRLFKRRFVKLTGTIVQ